MNNCCTLPILSGDLTSFTNAPLFVDTTGSDFHLQPNSPCINAGNNSYVTNKNDLDGNPRIVGSAVDVGAYEFQMSASGIFRGTCNNTICRWTVPRIIWTRTATASTIAGMDLRNKSNECRLRSNRAHTTYHGQFFFGNQNHLAKRQRQNLLCLPLHGFVRQPRVFNY